MLTVQPPPSSATPPPKILSIYSDRAIGLAVCVRAGAVRSLRRHSYRPRMRQAKIVDVLIKACTLSLSPA